MNKTVLFLFFVFLAFSAFSWSSFLSQNKPNKNLNQASLSIRKTTVTPSVEPQKETKSLFIPYWTLSSKDNLEESYDQIIYFGISANEKGIDKNEEGYKNIEKFVINYPDQTKYLTIRMLNSESNTQVLKNKNLELKIIQETLEITKNNSFDGIVLDFETQAMPFESVIEKINSFYKTFYSETKKENLKFLITIYGDVFYRLRPYDVKTLAQNSDKILIMAYDFHKAKGNPGPNFPLDDKLIYGYDFKTMIDDFVKNVSKEKITIIFGFYGYDWEVDEKNQNKNTASSLSLLQIQQKFLSNCTFKNCKVAQNKSLETSITYLDNQGKQHLIWFEDKVSVNKKIEYLKTKGLNDFAYWANSYF